jgi:uncharacterized membrane protein
MQAPQFAPDHFVNFDIERGLIFVFALGLSRSREKGNARTFFLHLEIKLTKGFPIAEIDGLSENMNHSDAVQSVSLPLSNPEKVRTGGLAATLLGTAASKCSFREVGEVAFFQAPPSLRTTRTLAPARAQCVFARRVFARRVFARRVFAPDLTPTIKSEDVLAPNAENPEPAEKVGNGPKPNSSRIVFLDLLRAMAVMMMAQGHTIDALLANQYRSYDYWGFTLWQFERGLTAPAFLLIAGTAFVYLLRTNAAPFRDNPRVLKGVKRAALLITIGYLMRLPASTVPELFSVTSDQWRVFWTVDVLQLIGMSLLAILALAFLSEKLKLSDIAVFACVGAFFFIGAPFTERLPWGEWLPGPAAAYFYTGSGSLFPLFPWTGYALFGGVLGAYLARGGKRSAPSRLVGSLIVAGAALLTFYFCVGRLKAAGFGSNGFWASYPELALLRLGTVLLLLAVVALASSKIRAIPTWMLMLGRQTLLIYVSHLVILYGSAWNSGLDRLCDKCLKPWPAVFAAVLMEFTVIGIAVGACKIRDRRFWAKLPTLIRAMGPGQRRPVTTGLPVGAFKGIGLGSERFGSRNVASGALFARRPASLAPALVSIDPRDQNTSPT